jgi:hypothetical protein
MCPKRYGYLGHSIEDCAEQHRWTPVAIVVVENRVQQVLAEGVGTGIMDVEDLGSVERVIEIQEDLEVEDSVLVFHFYLLGINVTKKERPAFEMKYRLKVMC